MAPTVKADGTLGVESPDRCGLRIGFCMAEPSRESLRRAVAALVPFVSTYRLPVNPEDLELVAYAVLRFATSSEDFADISPAVEQLISDHFADHARMMAAVVGEEASRIIWPSTSSGSILISLTVFPRRLRRR